MMRDFEIHLQTSERSLPDDPVGIAIGAGETVFTRLLREGANGMEDHLCAPPAQLAFWLVDNWWRLRSECVPSSGPTPEWRLAHDLSSIGGYAWPRVAIWGEGERIGLSSRSDPAGVVGPVRFLTDALIYVRAETFESEAENFLRVVSAERPCLTSDWKALEAQTAILAAERSDTEISAWRRLEAQLGYDVDEAPEELMISLAKLEEDYGKSAIEEAALAAQGRQAAEVLEAEIAAAQDNHWQCDLQHSAKLAGKVAGKQGDPPWCLAETAAKNVRKAIGHDGGPLNNSQLSELLSVRGHPFRSIQASGSRELFYGVRLNTGRRRGEVVALFSKWSADRRFEFARALGDKIWSVDERLGLITRAKSERQKFQRAFAQSLLCPFDDLVNYIGDDRTDGALSAAARHFHVSERVIRSVLVNKHTLARDRLNNFVQTVVPHYGTSSSEFDEMVEAA